MQQGRDNVKYRGETRVMLGEETLCIHNCEETFVMQ